MKDMKKIAAGIICCLAMLVLAGCETTNGRGDSGYGSDKAEKKAVGDTLMSPKKSRWD